MRIALLIRCHLDSRAALLDPLITNSQPQTPLSTASAAMPSISRFDRFRSQFRSLFTTNLSVNSNSIASNELDTCERRTSTQPIILSTRSYIQSHEAPPPYAEEPLSSLCHENDIQSLTSALPTRPSATLIRIRKHHIPLRTIRNHGEQPEQQSTSSPPLPLAALGDDEQASSDDDKMLVP